MLAGPYRVPNLEIVVSSAFTNRVPVTPYRGAGQPQAVFVIERVLDLVARATGRDPAAVRLANLIRPHEMPYNTGLPKYRGGGTVVYDSGDCPGVLREAIQLSRYEERRAECAAARGAGRLQGVGLACYVEGTALGPFEGATIRVEPSGLVVLASGVTSQGQGLETALAQICAGELGLAPEEISVVLGDTAAIEDGIGTYASRAAAVGGTAVFLAARELRDRLRRAAAAWLGVSEPEVEQRGGRFAARSEPERTVTLAELAAAAPRSAADPERPPRLEVESYFRPSDLTYASGAHVAMVEIDPDTGAVTVLGYWMSHDSGRLINPLIAEGQLQGAAVQGLGGALREEIVHDAEGQPLSATLMEYAVPRAVDTPPIEMAHLETPSPMNPLGCKGVGESGLLPTAAAVAAAVEDALRDRGVRVDRMPLTAPRLRELIRTAGE
jgi:CO/xanthine dehydrogenase Mo-binding subunit